MFKTCWRMFNLWFLVFYNWGYCKDCEHWVVWLRIGGEYTAVEGGRNSWRPMTIALGCLLNTNMNITLLQLFGKYCIAKFWKTPLFVHHIIKKIDVFGMQMLLLYYCCVSAKKKVFYPLWKLKSIIKCCPVLSFVGLPVQKLIITFNW